MSLPYASQIITVIKGTSISVTQINKVIINSGYLNAPCYIANAKLRNTVQRWVEASRIYYSISLPPSLKYVNKNNFILPIQYSISVHTLCIDKGFISFYHPN